jgi:drug/metabolite transporter (DMT)-like permease
VFCALAGLATLPFGWTWPTPSQLLALIMVGVLGGVSHLLLTESYRHAPASLVAPFDYMAMLWALVLGYFVFDEIPDAMVFIGAAIVIAAGLFVIWRERQLRVRRRREAEASPIGPLLP